MSKEVVSITPNAPLSAAASLMLSRKVRLCVLLLHHVLCCAVVCVLCCVLFVSAVVLWGGRCASQHTRWATAATA